MRRSASVASLLAFFALSAGSGCDGDSTTSTGTAGSGGSGASTTTTGGSGGDTTTGGGSGGSTTGGGGSGGATGGGGSGGATGGSTTGGGGSGGGGGMPVIDPVVDCAVPDIPPPSDPNATCEVTATGTAGVLFRGTLLLPDQVMHRGELLVGADGRIACADCDCSAAPGAGTATVVECADGVVSPGLINPHDHITYAQNLPIGANTPVAEGGHGTQRYDHRHQWRKGQDGKKQLIAPGGASTAQVLLAELRFVMGGATSAASAGGKAGLLRNLDTANLGEGLTIDVNSDTFPLDDSSGVRDPDASNGCDFGAAPTTASQIAADNAYLPHISEGVGPDAHTEFLCTSTKPPPSKANDILVPKTAIIHAIGLTATDITKIRTDTAKVIWSPRSNVDLYGNTAQVTLLDTLGVPVALGTDWLPTGSMNLLRELRCADELNTQYFAGRFTDKQLWQMVTTNAALAVGAESALGLLKPGYLADVAIFNGKDKKDHRAVIGAGPGDVVLVMRGGEVLYGDDVLCEDLRPGCEALDVCSSAKRACVTADVGGGTTLATLMTAAQTGYEMFSCPDAGNPGGTPTREPSCVPYRPGEYENGIVAGVDDDGDGVPNAGDNCPTVFNPKRPMDTKQADDDGDGKGDVCDPCPLDAMDACTALDPNDVDGDGWWNGYDNCPYRANPGQADADKDGHGDACDPCDGAPNPGPAACPPGSVDPLPIKAIRDPNDPDHPAEGDTVGVTGAYVTAIRPKTGGSQGFYVQDTSLAPYTGIFIFTGGTSPTVEIGNRVSVQGIYSEYFGLSELSNVVVVVDDPGTVLPFSPIAIASPSAIASGGVMAEGYESMLVKIGAVTITSVNPDAPSDFDEFSVTGGLRIDDQIFDNVKDMGLNNACAAGTPFDSITGIHSYSFSNYKLLPRFAADIVQPAGAACKPYP